MKRTKNPAKEAEYRKRAADLVAQMTLHEKVSQMLSWAPAIERLGIPAYNWWSEGIHGVGRAGTATVFPQAIGMAAAFDEDMMEQVGNAIGVEARGKYNMCRAHGDRDIFKGLTVWAPNINIFRDPRWGRGHETYGEDPFLTSRLGVRFVEGMQGNDPDYLQAAACAKHFAVHSGPESDRHHFNAIVSKQDLWETYLPAFRALVKEAGVEAVMGAYNRTNGEPCCGSKTLLKDILRDKWHFDGHVTSDCWAIKDFHTGHMVTDGPVESVALAVNNGCDLNCGDLYVYLEQAVAEGKLSEEKIDESLTRLYVTRMRLGMFDAEDQVPYNKVGYDVVDSAEMKALNLKVADSIMTLLKNDGTLPLALLVVCLAVKGRIGGLIESSLAAFPAEANISEFSAKTPVMTLYCFIFGMAAFAAVRENKQFLYGAFCILLAVLTNFQRAGFECVFTVLVLLAVQNPQGVGLAENQKFAQAVEFVGAGSFWLYLAHPLVLELLPNTAMGGAAAWLCFAGVYAVCLMVCYALYTLFVRRYEQHFA